MELTSGVGLSAQIDKMNELLDERERAQEEKRQYLKNLRSYQKEQLNKRKAVQLNAIIPRECCDALDKKVFQIKQAGNKRFSRSKIITMILQKGIDTLVI